MLQESSTRQTTAKKVVGLAGQISPQKVQILKTSNDRTPANDPRNRGERIPGWGFDPNWVNGSVQMASLVFDAAKPMQCPLRL